MYPSPSGWNSTFSAKNRKFLTLIFKHFWLFVYLKEDWISLGRGLIAFGPQFGLKHIRIDKWWQYFLDELPITLAQIIFLLGSACTMWQCAAILPLVQSGLK